MHVYHERALPKLLDSLEQTLKVPAEHYCVPKMTISETGYVQLPHNNKYGMSYSSGDAEVMYSKDGK
jgi:hypothetical protein